MISIEVEVFSDDIKKLGGGMKEFKNKQKEILLEVENMTISFGMYDSKRNRREFEMVHNLSLRVNSGEILVVAGSSGSGKSLLAHAVLGILPGNAVQTGKIFFRGQELNHRAQERLRGREIGFIPQSVTYLDPLMRVEKQVIGVCKRKERKQQKKRLREIFERYQLEESVAKLYPYQLSGGMARRVLIAGSVMNQASLIVADEPTPGLNRKLEEEMLQDFRKLAEEGCGILLITHEIDLAFEVADRIAVMYGGTVVETADVRAFKSGKGGLRHPFSQAFLQALPQNEFCPIKGLKPYEGKLPNDCVFAGCCPEKTMECEGEIPLKIFPDGEVRCIHAE